MIWRASVFPSIAAPLATRFGVRSGVGIALLTLLASASASASSLTLPGKAAPWTIGALAMTIAAQREPAATLARTSIPASLSGRLDGLLSQRKYVELGDALEGEHRAGRGLPARQWQEQRLRDGASAYLGFVFSREMMRAASGAPRQRKPALQEKAALIAIYTMAVLTIDGPRCADASAATRRTEQLFDLAAEAFGWAAALPEARRERLIDAALTLEQHTSAQRADDAFICQGGAEDVARALEDPGSRLEPKTTPDGGYTLTPATPSVAEFVEASRSRPLQALARRTIRADLCRMLEQMRS